MPITRVTNLGDVGISTDLAPSAIAANAFSYGRNIRALQGQICNFGGHSTQTVAPIEPYSLFAIRTANQVTYWIEAGLTSVYVYDGSTHTDITRISGPYTGNEYFDRWTGGFQGTLAAINNAADGPQQWTTINPAVPLVDMMYDPTAAPGSQTWQELGYRTFAMRPFQNFMLALGIQRGATELPSLLQWSEVISPGATTIDWVPRTTNSAGEKYLGETSGNIIDGESLRNDFIIYKEDSAYRMSFTGDARAPFIFERLPDYIRIINRNCIGRAQEFHALASRNDAVIYDGNAFRSILDRKRRRYYIDTMDPDRVLTTFVAVLNKEHEVWFCFPSAGQPGELKFPDRAIVWNYKDGTISDTDLPQVRDLDQGVVISPIEDTFDSVIPSDATFDEDILIFDATPFTAALEFMVGAYSTNVAVFGEDVGDEGNPRQCIAERTGIVFTDPDTRIQTTGRQHRIRTVRPYITSNGIVQVRVGVQKAINGPILWTADQDFDPTTQTHLTFRSDLGSFGAFRISSNALVEWKLHAMELEHFPLSKRA